MFSLHSFPVPIPSLTTLLMYPIIKSKYFIKDISSQKMFVYNNSDQGIRVKINDINKEFE